MEAISTEGATPARLGKEGRDMLVGASAHPEIRVHWRGSLGLARGSWHLLREDSGLQSKRWHCNNPSPPLPRIPWPSGAPEGRPQPPPALLEDFLLAVGRACPPPPTPPHTRLPATPAPDCQLAGLPEPALLCPLFLGSPPTVGGGGLSRTPPGWEHRAAPPLPGLQRPRGMTNPCPCGASPLGAVRGGSCPQSSIQQLPG